MADTKHVFISYVREDQAHVDKLVAALKLKGAEIWIDRDSIEPGQLWPDAIRHAIATGNFFLACFSQNAISKPSSGMNEEIMLVTHEFRRFQYGTAWFLPVKLDKCTIPDIDIGDGQTLRDLQWIDLWQNWERGINRLAETTLRLDKKGQQAQLKTLAKEAADKYVRVRQSHFRRSQDSWSPASTDSAGKAETAYERAKALYDDAQVRYVRQFNEEFHPLAGLIAEADKRASAWTLEEQRQWEDAQKWGRTFTISIVAVMFGIVLLIGLVRSFF